MAKRDALFSGALLALLFTIHLAIGPLVWTGDEPRYVLAGLGFAGGKFALPTAEAWNHFVIATHYSTSELPYLRTPMSFFAIAPSMAPSIVYALPLSALGLEGARWVSFALGVVGLATTFALLRLRHPTSAWPARAALATIALSIPLIEYLRLIFPETMLFALVSAALFSLYTKRYMATVGLIACLPFVHIRALPLEFAFFALAVTQAFRERLRANRIVAMSALFALGVTAYVGLQWHLFGSIGGGAFSTNPIAPGRLVERLGIQMFDVRHGLFAYSPVFLVAIAGLIAGALARDRLATSAAFLLGTYVLTFMWSAASESYAGRFWVASLPFMAVGLAHWISRATSRWAVAPVVALGAFTLYNLASFVASPQWFLDSRRTSLSYANLYRLTHFQLGLFLPADEIHPALPGVFAPIPLLLVITTFVVISLVATIALRSPNVRCIAATVGLAAILIPIASSVLFDVPTSSYSIDADRRFGILHLRLARVDGTAVALRLDDKLGVYWDPARFPAYFAIRCSRAGRTIGTSLEPARALVALPPCTAADTIDVASRPRIADSTLFDHLGAVVLMRRPDFQTTARSIFATSRSGATTKQRPTSLQTL